MNLQPTDDFKEYSRVCSSCNVRRHISFFQWYRCGKVKPKMCSTCWFDRLLAGMENRQYRKSVFFPYHDEIVALAAQGYRATEIIHMLACSNKEVMTLRTYCTAHGISTRQPRMPHLPALRPPNNRKLTDDTIEKIRVMVNTPRCTYTEIGLTFHITRNAVAGIVYGYSLRGMKTRPEKYVRKQKKSYSRDTPPRDGVSFLPSPPASYRRGS